MTTAIILAGGMGTRLRDVVSDVPKPLAPIAGRPFLEYQLDYWILQGVSRFILSLGYRAQAISNHFGRSYGGAKIDYVIETEPMGTGGGLLLAAARLEDDDAFLLLNGDTYFSVDFVALRRFHSLRGSDWTFSLFRAKEENRYLGLTIDPGGSIRNIGSGKGKVGDLANGGVYLIEPTALRLSEFERGVKVSLEDELLPAFQRAGVKLFGMESDGAFIDIGVPKDYFRAAQVLV